MEPTDCLNHNAQVFQSLLSLHPTFDNNGLPGLILHHLAVINHKETGVQLSIVLFAQPAANERRQDVRAGFEALADL